MIYNNSDTLATFAGSILTELWEITTPRYSTEVFSNLHFSGLRVRLCCWRIPRTHRTTIWCSSKVLVKIRMLSKYTTTTPSEIKSSKIVSTMVWKVAITLTHLLTIGSFKPSVLRRIKPQQVKKISQVQPETSHTMTYNAVGVAKVFKAPVPKKSAKPDSIIIKAMNGSISKGEDQRESKEMLASPVKGCNAQAAGVVC